MLYLDQQPYTVLQKSQENYYVIIIFSNMGLIREESGIQEFYLPIFWVEEPQIILLKCLEKLLKQKNTHVILKEILN